MDGKNAKNKALDQLYAISALSEHIKQIMIKAQHSKWNEEVAKELLCKSARAIELLSRQTSELINEYWKNKQEI